MHFHRVSQDDFGRGKKMKRKDNLQKARPLGTGPGVFTVQGRMLEARIYLFEGMRFLFATENEAVTALKRLRSSLRRSTVVATNLRNEFSKANMLDFLSAYMTGSHVLPIQQAAEVRNS